MFEKLFRLSDNSTTVGREVTAGFTTFLAMSYIIFIQPALLSGAGMDFGAVMMATCLSSFVACLCMAFLANYPIALAPGMGENFFFFAVVVGMGFSWQKTLGAVFVSGAVFLVLSVFRLRERIITAVPSSLKSAIPAAIGVLITVIGLTQAGIVIKDPGGGIATLGDFHSPPTLLSIIGIAIILLLMTRNIRGAILLGIGITAVIGMFMGVVRYQGVVAMPPSIAPTAFKLDIAGAFEPGMISVLIIFLLMDMFDTVGTLIGVGEAAGMMKDGNLPRARQALLSDAIGTIVGALFGTSTVTSYVESTTGVREGGRTGLSAVVVGLLMLLAIFFSPLVAMIGGGYPILDDSGELVTTLYPVSAPALILVGAFMMRSIRGCHWEDLTEAVPALMTIVGMAMTFNVSNGLAFGFILYPALKLMAGRGREVSWLMYLLALVFVMKFVFIS